MKKKTEHYFKKAKEVSRQSTYTRVHIGCVAVYKGQIVATGKNLEKTHPDQEYYNQFRGFKDKQPCIPKVHAEIDCLTQLKKRQDIVFSKVKLYIFRERLDHKIGMCRPCPGCLRAIQELGIKDIYYTTNFGFAHEHLS